MKRDKSANFPPHYRGLSLRNFRSFKKAEHIPLAPLTFLVGPNSAGKSTLFDALLLLAQSQFSPTNERAQVPNWAGPLVDLGAFRDSVYRHDAALAIEIGVELSAYFKEADYDYRGSDVNQPMKISYELRASQDDPIGRLSAVTVTDVLTGKQMQTRYAKESITVKLMGSILKWPPKTRRYISLFGWFKKEIEQLIRRRAGHGNKAAWQRILRTFPLQRLNGVIRLSERVSSGRSAPRRWYSIAEATFERGKSSARVFSAVEPIMIQDSRYSRRRDLKATLSSVLGELGIGDNLHDSKLSPYHVAISIRDNITGITSNLIDVGYGASQVIPVLWACLSNSWGPLFIEQLEIHLHPKAQGTIADFICNTSRRRQVIVETHSVHMINRARIMIAQGKFPASHVIVNYVERTGDGSHVHTIPILENGEFAAEWPEGFFDERYEDTMLLLKLKSQKES